MFKHGGAGLYIFFSILSSIEISEDAKINHITLQFSTNIFGNIWEKKKKFRVENNLVENNFLALGNIPPV